MDTDVVETSAPAPAATLAEAERTEAARFEVALEERYQKRLEVEQDALLIRGIPNDIDSSSAGANANAERYRINPGSHLCKLDPLPQQ